MSRFGILHVSQELRSQMPKGFLPPGHAIVAERVDPEWRIDCLLIEGPLMPGADAANAPEVRMLCSLDISTGRRIVTSHFEHAPATSWKLDVGTYP